MLYMSFSMTLSSRILRLLVLATKPLTATEIAHHVNASAASVSSILKKFADKKTIRRSQQLSVFGRMAWHYAKES